MSVLDDFDSELEKRVNKKVQSIVKSQEDNDDGAGNVKDFSKQQLDKDDSAKKEAAKAAKEKKDKEGDKVEQEVKDANKKPAVKKSVDKLEVKSLNVNGVELAEMLNKSIDEKVNKSLDDLNAKIDNDSTKAELEKSIQVFVKSFKTILDGQDKITAKQEEIAKSLKATKPVETKKSLSTPKETPVDKSASYATHDATSTVEDQEKEVKKSVTKPKSAVNTDEDILKGLDMDKLWDKFNVRMAKNINKDEFSATPLKELSGNVYYHTADKSELKKFVDFANGKDIELY